MTEPSRYEIEIRGRATERVLHPVIDDFRIEPTGCGTTRLVGEIRDPSHLNGLLAHFTSMNVEVVGLHRVEPDAPRDADERSGRCDQFPDPNHPTNQEGTTP
jgi:hypothetical protein